MDRNIDICGFKSMDKIREKYGISYGDWAEAAFGRKEYQNRISELKTLARGEEIKRAFTLEKFSLLFNGLKEIIGDKAMEKEIDSILKHVTDPCHRLLIVACSIPKQNQREAEKDLSKYLITKKE